MFEARFAGTEEEKAEGAVIRVEDYRKETHRGHLLCGDFNCAARLYYRDEARAFGDVKLRVPHFATFPRDVHRDECTHHNPDTEERVLRNLRAALIAGQRILVNLNLDLGLSLGDDFSRAAEPAREDTPYGRFLRRGNYFAVSAKSVGDMMRLRNALVRSGHEDALRRAYVGHRHEIRKFENVFIGMEKEKLRILFNGLSAGDGVMMAGPHTVVTGFPRVIHFTPTQKTRREGLRSGKINGTSQWVGRAGAEGFVLLQNLGLKDGALRRDILENAASYVLAAPTVDRAAGLRDGKFAMISWRVQSEAQYMADTEVKVAQVQLL